MTMQGFVLAQATHDAIGRAGPPSEPLCTFCDGDRRVEVAAIKDRDGRVSDFPSDIDPAEVDCPHCVGRSEERV